MNKFYIAAGAIIASSLVVSLPEKAQALSELGATGVKMPVVSNSGYYSYQQIPLNSSGGTQYINLMSSDASINDMITGNLLKRIFTNIESVATNDQGSLFIATKSRGTIYYATVLEDAQKLTTDFKMKTVHGFLSKTNTFIGTYDNRLMGYNFDTKQLEFTLQLGNEYNNLFAINKDIAVANGNNITIYDEKGNYKDVLQFDSEITSITYSPDGQMLLVGTEKSDIQCFDANSSYKANNIPLFKDTQGSNKIVFDSTGDYVGAIRKVNNYNEDMNLRLFSLKQNQRIYTELDNEEQNRYGGDLVLSNNAKFIQYGGTTYNAKNITKSPKSISLPTQYITMEAGSELKPAVTAKLLDGTTTTMTDGVTWKSDDLSVAYYDEYNGVFKPKQTGTFTLRASYLGFSTDVQVTVTKSPLSGIKEYLAKHTESGYYISNLGVKGIYLDQRIYKGSSYKGKNVVTTFTGKKNGKPVTYLDVARKANSAIKFKKIEIQANGKTLKKNTKSNLYKDGYEAANSIKLSTADRKWIKENIDVNKPVTAKLKGTKKTVTIKLTKTQKDALLKGVLVNDYLK